MLVVEIDRVDPEPGQTCIARSANMIRGAGDPRRPAALVPGAAKLGGENDFVATALEPAAQVFFVFAGAVDIGTIEEVDTEFEGTIECGGDVPVDVEKLR